LADNSVDLIATDPPYYKVKGEQWDRQWSTAEGFLSWLDLVLTELHRLLKPNGSLYMFASPQMASRVEVLISQRFNVLNHITWQKPPYSTKAEMSKKSDLRAYFPSSERVIFAEHKTEHARAYLDGERKRAGLETSDIAKAYQKKTGTRTVTGMARHWFYPAQWELPTEDNYEWLRYTMSALNHGGRYLERDYKDIARPFNVSADVPYTDVWTFKTVNAYPGKHPTEKPLAMMRHIIAASSREGATVLDCFMGGGTTGKAAQELGRNFIGIEKDAKYFAQAQRRIENVQPALVEVWENGK
jgi:adenine-specific DNA-methyltransferase